MIFWERLDPDGWNSAWLWPHSSFYPPIHLAHKSSHPTCKDPHSTLKVPNRTFFYLNYSILHHFGWSVWRGRTGIYFNDFERCVLLKRGEVVVGGGKQGVCVGWLKHGQTMENSCKTVDFWLRQPVITDRRMSQSADKPTNGWTNQRTKRRKDKPTNRQTLF